MRLRHIIEVFFYVSISGFPAYSSIPPFDPISDSMVQSLGDPAGWPGISHHWLSSLKQAVGTAYEAKTADSPIWFTVSEGVMSEVFYPHNDQAQVGYLEFVVTDGENYFSEQRSGPSNKNGAISPDGKFTEVKYEDEGMTVHIQGEDKLRFYRFDQYIIADTASPTLRIHTEIKWNPTTDPSKMRVFVLFKPAIGNSASHNLGATDKKNGLFATSIDSPISSALVSSVPWVSTSVGYVGFSDPWQDLSQNFRLTQPWQQVGAGNINLAGEIQMSPGKEFSFDLALSFGASRIEAQTYANTFLSIPYEQARDNYENGWQSYLLELQNTSHEFEDTPFVRKSAQIIKMHEDKLTRGAIVASLSKPTLSTHDHNGSAEAGYHAIWPTDLYFSALGLLAAGDLHTPIEVLGYFRKTQQKNGSWPESAWINGIPLQNRFLAKDAAYPILLAHQLEKRGIYHLSSDDLEMIRNATSFILTHGPSTDTSSLALEISALKISSQIIHDEETSQIAQLWQSTIEKETLLQNGTRGKNYYARDVLDALGTRHEFIDGGFLNLVRLGIRDPKDPRILTTLAIYEDPRWGVAANVPEIPKGLIFRENNQPIISHLFPEGSYFPSLVGEYGEYLVSSHQIDRARTSLLTLEESSTPSGMFPEQLSQAPSSTLHVRLGVACPLVRAHAENILLHRSIEEGTVFDAPAFK